MDRVLEAGVGDGDIPESADRLLAAMAEAGRVVTDWVGDPGAVLEYGVRFAAMVPVPDDDTGTTLTVGGRVEEKLDNRQVAVVLEAKALDASVLSKARAVVQLS